MAHVLCMRTYLIYLSAIFIMEMTSCTANTTRSFNCNFESGPCGWTQVKGNSSYWTKSKGRTPSNATGPNEDHITGTTGSYYYIELVGFATFVSPQVQTAQAKLPKCFTFWYIIYGSSRNRIHVYIKVAQVLRSLKSIFFRYGYYEQQWKKALIDITPTVPFQIEIDGILGHLGYIAIDDISIADGYCQQNGSLNCDDPSICGYVQSTSDIFNWTWATGTTDSLVTGPRNDHTYKTAKGIRPCEKEVDESGVVWEITAPGQTQTKRCTSGYTGSVIRSCRLQEGGSGNWKKPNYTNCVRTQIIGIEKMINDLDSGTGDTSVVINAVLGTLYNISDTVELTSGDIIKSNEILFKTVETANSNGSVVLNQNIFFGILDNTLSNNRIKQWRDINEQSSKSGSMVLELVSNFGAVFGKQLSVGRSEIVKKKNLVVEIQNSPSTDDISFPTGTVMGSDVGAKIHFPKQNIDSQVPNVISTSAIFKTASSILPLEKNNQYNDSLVGSVIAALSLNVDVGEILKRNVSLIFSINQNNMTKPQVDCAFWNFSLEGGEGWSTEGCYLVNMSSTSAVCECNHLTNFAILMSPSNTPENHVKALKIISIIGCSISLVGLLLTFIVYLALWRKVKSRRSVLLVHLCSALGIANLVFLVAVDKVKYKEFCIFVTALLHYLYLVVFFIMFAKGLLILIAVKVVFKTESKIKLLLVLVWGIPAIIVSITVGLSYSKKYHSDNFCWLTLSNGVLFAFIAPVLLIIAGNVVIIKIVLNAMYLSHGIKTKSSHEKAKTGLRSMCTLLPILGVTWVFGVLSINEDLIVFQYLFAITNSLQGLFIFVFHCALSPQVRDALKKRMRRYEIKPKVNGNPATNDKKMSSKNSSGV